MRVYTKYFTDSLLFSVSFLIAGSIVHSVDAYSSSTTSVTAQQYKYLVSYNQANKIALMKIPGATVTNMELKKSGTLFIYEIELYLNGTTYELVLNAKTGSGISVLKYLDNSYTNNINGTPTSVDLASLEKQTLSNTGSYNHSYPSTTASSNLIGTNRAKEIALAKVPNGEVVYLRQDRDDGRISYEGKIIEGHIEYEFDIDAYSGAILDWDTDYIYD